MNLDSINPNEKLLEKARARGIYTEHELNVLWPAFLQNRELLTVNKNKQYRHIIGSKEFLYFNTKSLEVGKAGYSFFFSDFNIIENLPKLIGNGIVEFDKGVPKRETIKCPRNIGMGGKDSLVVTNVLSIRYSLTGIHAFPVHPNIYNDIVDSIKKKNRQARFTASCRSVLVGFNINIHSFLVKVKSIIKKLIHFHHFSDV